MKSKNFTLNPYIVGKPIYEKEKLFGRENTVKKIKDNITNNRKITLLHVQRRIGKTSLINCLPQFFTEEKNGFKFVTFSFQGYKYKSIPEILNYLADDISASIDGLPKQARELGDSSYNFFQLFLPKIINEYLSGKKLVLLLDEFDVLEEDTTIYNRGKKLFDELGKVFEQEEKLFAILVFGTPLKDITYLEEFLQKEDQEIIEIGVLDRDSTEQLIVKPAQGILEYEPSAIDKIWQLSAGHPSLTQLLCHNIFVYCQEKGIRKVVPEHIELILDQAMLQGGAILEGFRQPLNELEKLFFSVVAEAQEIGITDPLKMIKPTREVPISALRQAGKHLVEYGFLEKKGKGYKIKIELVRLWMVQNHPLFDEERLEMQKISNKNQNLPETNNNYKIHILNRNNNSQGPNQIAKVLSLFVVSLIIVIPGIYSFYLIRHSSNFRASRSECSRLLQEINVALGGAKERSRVIEKVRNEWSRKEESLDLQCPYNYELDRKYNELLYRYGWNQINIGEYDKAIKPLCEITEEYEKFREVENILSEWILLDKKLSMENKEKVIEALIEQNQSGNDCLAYSFKSERNKNQLDEEQEKLSKQKNQQRNESFYRQAQERIKSFEFEKAVEAYCQISEDYEKFPDIQKQLQGWLSGDPDLYDDEREKVIEKLTQLKNNCPVSPLK